MPAVLAGILIPHVVCSLFIYARIWSRLYLLRRWFLDDTFIVCGWAASTVVCILYSVAAQTPAIRDSAWMADGRVGAPVPVEVYLLKSYLGLVFYQLCLILTKLSILAFYLRIFAASCSGGGGRRSMIERRLAQATVVIVVAFGIPLLAMSVFQCHPGPGRFFGRPMACFSFKPLLVASASLHAATDAWLIVLIVPCVARLADLPRRQKIALAGVLSLGVFVVAAGMIRLQLVLRDGARPRSGSTLAFFVMTILECDVALICASAPMLRPIIVKIWPRAMDESAGFGRGSGFAGAGAQRRRAAAYPNVEDDSDSVNLTTVVSYHGYPWTRPTTPRASHHGDRAARSRSRSISKDGKASSTLQSSDMQAVPVPPVPAHLMPRNRTPTAPSLRSMLSGGLTRSRHGVTETKDELPVPTRDGADDSRAPSWIDRRRSSAAGLDGFFYEQFFGLGAGSHHDGASNGRPSVDYNSRRSRRNSRALSLSGAGMGMSDPPLPLPPSRSDRRWNQSQESFVLGLNDPASPSRMSPLSGFSRESYTTVLGSGSGDKRDSVETVKPSSAAAASEAGGTTDAREKQQEVTDQGEKQG